MDGAKVVQADIAASNGVTDAARVKHIVGLAAVCARVDPDRVRLGAFDLQVAE